MKLSNETLGVLKNFGSINQSILFKKGKTLKTVSPHKNILAEATITEEIPVEFGVYDLNNFLSVVSLYKDEPSFEFEDKQVLIVGNQGRSKKTYRFCEATMIVTPPEKKMELPTPEIKFDLSAQDFDWVMKNASVLSTPHIAVESNGKKINVVCLDLQNDAANTDSLEICDGSGSKYRMIFKTENLDKLLGGDYSVEISSKGIAQFTHKKLPVKYWISTESGSKFESK